ncbi:nucleotidyltransferase [Amphibacillus cookii]|uniref:nucleotidyltransferase n=1 Tax=Amphibacillus cookii TaxID=767787 RepID=UPI00195CB9EA|nr:nucleotidyltransferase [Amphibacillus cookii]MBM7540463.1 putative nucleotidyltransferase [Amphibacillus cookii]
MKAVGLIVEYNPFHNGHLYHIEQARVKSNADVVIAVMSGQFLQRGEPAIVDKFTRAKMAIEHGVDLIFELPTVFAIQHSDIFGYAAVQLLNQIGVNMIVFGSEQGDITPFKTTINEIERNKTTYNKVLKEHLHSGVSYPKANALAIQKLSSTFSMDLDQPNNILGLSYLKAQKAINPYLKMETIQRKQAEYHQHQLSQPITSATSIRAHLNELTDLNHDDLAMPKLNLSLLKAYAQKAGRFHYWEDYFPLLKYRILSDTTAQLKQIHGMNEGIEHRLKKQIVNARNYDDFLTLVQTKRYTKTRIQRLLAHVLLHLTTLEVEREVYALKKIDTVRLLGMTEKGQAYLKRTRQTRSVNIIGQYKKNMPDFLSIDERASNIYYMTLNQAVQNTLKQQEFAPPLKKEVEEK